MQVIIQRRLKELQARRTELGELLLEGRASDWAHYKELVGEGKGLQEGIEALQGSLKDDEGEED